jgi:hydrogenase maturation protease
MLDALPEAEGAPGVSASPEVLVIGIGNADRGDDGVGPAVIAALVGRLSSDIHVITRAGDMLGLIEDWAGFQRVICVDAAAPMDEPGRIYRVDLATDAVHFDFAPASGHAFGLPEAWALALQLDRAPAALVVYAVEAEGFEIGTGLSAPVAMAVEAVADLIMGECAVARREAAAS